MKLLKPSWVNLDGKPIFSIDIHPLRHILATGGMGEDCGRIVLWNMAPIRREEDEVSKKVPKAFSELTNHEACVNVVRWSPDGKYLASGSDDTFGMIWQLKSSHGKYGLVHILRGHHGDVLDLAWSGDGSYLATCSIDNTVNIWNGKALFQLVSTLKGHKDMVKGVTWDPVGKYLATQSTDKTLRIWKRGEWKEEACVTKPFKSCGTTTHVLRLSWSPDGQYIVSAHALNNRGPVAEIVQRSEWQTGMDFVGHRKAIEVVRFNTHLFTKGESTNQGCVAMGGKDRSVSVWLTGGTRPLVVLHDLFTNSVVDASWSASGYELITCSLDGTVAYMCFTEKELGKKLSQEAVNEVYVNLYGVSSVAATTDDLAIVDNPELLKLASAQQTSKSQPPQPTTQDQPASCSSSPTTFLPSTPTFSSQSSNQRTVINQKETRTKDGRRRITPVMLSQPLSSSPSSLPGPPPPPPVPPAPVSPTPQQLQEKEKIPTSVQTRPTASDFPSEVSWNVETASTTTAAIIKPLPQVDAPIQVTGGGATKRHHEEDKSTGKRSKRSKLTDSTKLSSSPVKGVSKPQHVQSLLAVPEVQPTVSIRLNLEGDKDISLEVSNQESHGILKCQENGKATWSVILLENCVCVAGSTTVVAAGGCKGTIQMFSMATGRSLFPPFSLSFPPVALVCKKYFVCAITSDTKAWLWDLKNDIAVVKGVVISPLSSGAAALTRLTISDNGHIVVSTATQNTYLYHVDMSTWVQVSNPNEKSKFASTNAGGVGSDGPLKRLQVNPNTFSSTTPSMSSQQFIEHQIKRSSLLFSPTEYLHWSTTYMTTLVKEGNEGRIKEYCYELINSKQTSFVGFGKQWLVDQLLPIVASNAKLQRVYSELKQARDAL